MSSDLNESTFSFGESKKLQNGRKSMKRKKPDDLPDKREPFLLWNVIYSDFF